MATVPLTRSRDDRVVAGVCSGLATHLSLPVMAVRIGMLVLALFGGAGALLYLWLWITVPAQGETDGIVPLRRALTRPAEHQSAETTQGSSPTLPPLLAGKAAFSGSDGEPQGAPASEGAAPSRSRWPIAELLLGACLLVAGVGLVLSQLGVQINLELILPAMAVLVGVGLTWWQIADRDRPDRNQVPRVMGALALVAVGVLMFFVTAREPSVWTVVAAAVAVLAGVALAIAPWVLRVNRELMAERAARARESERAEIAAHLHDSVLQTLALIQQRSEPGSEVSRLARRQERELREWLFRTADGAPAEQLEAVDAELRGHAAALENEHAVRFEIVAVGVGDGVVAPAPLVAAAREAMLNAARHAGGDVTVYLEVTPDRLTIDVTDRGPGMDVEALPEGRMGVRESILGRMERAGGTAKIVPGPGGNGTAVRLSLPRDQELAAGQPTETQTTTSSHTATATEGETHE
ncbi:PspC domain-containing protein [Leucobacter viscericola]|uniref:PspC domain-containing protein n=1 Tax=Leucobacter viscericola TaxID=2714935 RepID=A0A6G7XHZ1_9MICO|nr:ATP-binding protein [Leucobacter viscericola]QIK63997.1 PspC domain-containing protein [Leucobacter viscericola]